MRLPGVQAGILQATARLLLDGEPTGEGETSVLEAVRAYYTRYDSGPAWWHAGEGPQRLERSVHALARAIHENGLQASDYPLGTILQLAGLEAPSEAERAKADVLLTLAMAQFAQQVRHGRLDPRAVNEILDYPVRSGDLARTVRFVAVGDVAERLEALPPVHAEYRELRDLLRTTREAEDWAVVHAGPLLRPGERDDRVPALRRRLAVEDGFGFRPYGDLQGELYDERLAAAMERFQARNGLDVDGLVGTMTQRALAESRDIRISRIRMNLERWRWMPPVLGRDHVMVNIPDYRLTIVEAGEPARDMPVIVGKPDRKTPTFSSRLTWLEINPTWTLTERIATLDLLPKLLDNPAYLAEQGITMFADWTADAPVIDTSYVDWERLGGGIRYFRLRQEPGPANPLGRVKFMMENSFSVYLHDTNNPGLFDETVRPFSSGCIRVADPRWLAGYLLHRPDAWTEEQQEEPFQDWETRRIILKQPMRVHLAYFTAWAGDDGQIRMRDDIYGFDAQMAEAWGTGGRVTSESLAALN